MKKNTPPALTETSAARLVAFTASFPCLAGRPGVEPFDLVELAAFTVTEAADGQTPAYLDSIAASSFIVWLYVVGLMGSPLPVGVDKRKNSAIVQAAAEFRLEDFARWGSPVTRAIVAAWLAAPWFPEAAAK